MLLHLYFECVLPCFLKSDERYVHISVQSIITRMFLNCLKHFNIVVIGISFKGGNSSGSRSLNALCKNCVQVMTIVEACEMLIPNL